MSACERAQPVVEDPAAISTPDAGVGLIRAHACFSNADCPTGEVCFLAVCSSGISLPNVGELIGNVGGTISNAGGAISNAVDAGLPPVPGVLPGGAGKACASNADCTAPLLCVAGLCV